MSDEFKMKRKHPIPIIILRMTLALVVSLSLTSCGLSVSGGAAIGDPLPAEEQKKLDEQQQAERQAQEQREQSQQQTADMKERAINALENAMQSFIHDSAGPLTEEARQMMRDIFALKQSLESTSDPRAIWEGFHQAQSLLYDAYPIAVSVGAVNPTVVGQRGWQETWWFISSP